MLRPKEMNRVLIVGPKSLLEPSIEVLHSLGLLHIVDFTSEDETFHLGKPLPRASQISEALVRLRSISNVLKIEHKPEVKPVELGPEVRERIASMEAGIAEREAERKALESQLADVFQRLEVLRPFAAIGLDLDYYRDYASLDVLVGRITGEVSEIQRGIPEAEVFSGDSVVAVFLPKSKSAAAREFLTRLGFAALDIPPGSGDPRAKQRELDEEWRGTEEKVRSVEEALAEDKNRFADFVLGADRTFSQEIEKAEAPLRFAITDHSFIVDGWIPTDNVQEMKGRLEALGTLHILVEEPEYHTPPPVLLENPKPIKPFETLIHLYATPSYYEIDPTLYISLALPFFFGFMIGDAGFGAAWIALGAYGRYRYFKHSPGWRNICFIVMVGGIVTLLFGLFVYGEAFGLAFHPPPGTAEGAQIVTWESLGLHYPLEPLIEKAAAESVTTLLFLSVVMAWVHLSIGFATGFVNEWRHSKPHAIGKIGWLLTLLGLFMTILARLYWHPLANFFWTYIFPIPHRGPAAVGFLTSTLGFQLPWVAFILIIIGAGLASLESYIAIVEVGGVLANMLSYGRLAGIAIGEAAVDGAITSLVFGSLIFTGNVGLAILGIVLLLMAESLLMLLLSGIAVFIQALRLNYVEQFIKFYKGDGIPFNPFGRRRTEA